MTSRVIFHFSNDSLEVIFDKFLQSYVTLEKALYNLTLALFYSDLCPRPSKCNVS